MSRKAAHLYEIYTYKGQRYRARQMVRLKHPTTGEWVDAVAYTKEYSGELYVREATDFRAKFVPEKLAP